MLRYVHEPPGASERIANGIPPPNPEELRAHVEGLIGRIGIECGSNALENVEHKEKLELDEKDL